MPRCRAGAGPCPSESGCKSYCASVRHSTARNGTAQVNKQVDRSRPAGRLRCNSLPHVSVWSRALGAAAAAPSAQQREQSRGGVIVSRGDELLEIPTRNAQYRTLMIEEVIQRSGAACLFARLGAGRRRGHECSRVAAASRRAARLCPARVRRDGYVRRPLGAHFECSCCAAYTYTSAFMLCCAVLQLNL